MPNVARDQDGHVTSTQDSAEGEAREARSAKDPERQSIPNIEASRREIQHELANSDLELIRVLEDLIFVLIDKNVIMLTDIPAAARDKIARRFELRDRLTNLEYIVGDGEDIPYL